MRQHILAYDGTASPESIKKGFDDMPYRANTPSLQFLEGTQGTQHKDA